MRISSLPVAKPLNKRGFTLIELGVVITVLILVAFAVWPSIFAMQRSREYRDFRLGVRRLATFARESAITRKEPVSLAYDDGARQLRVVAEGEQESVLETITAPESVTAGPYSQGGSDTNSADWRLRFFADGSSEGGAVQFQSGQDTFYIAAREAGEVRFGEGEMPNLGNEKWQAGTYEQRQ
jgi:Tfp pilus assembly protein FimT